MTDQIIPTRDDVLAVLNAYPDRRVCLSGTEIAWRVFTNHKGAWYSGLEARKVVSMLRLNHVLVDLTRDGEVVSLDRDTANRVFGFSRKRASVSWASKQTYDAAMAEKAAKAATIREKELLAEAQAVVLQRHAAEVQDALTRLRNEAKQEAS